DPRRPRRARPPAPPRRRVERRYFFSWTSPAFIAAGTLRSGAAVGGGAPRRSAGGANAVFDAGGKGGGTLPSASANTSSPKRPSAWKSPTSGGDQPAACCGFPLGRSIRYMLMRQTSPGSGGSRTAELASIPLTSSSGSASSTVHPLSWSSRLLSVPSTCTLAVIFEFQENGLSLGSTVSS